MEITEKVVSYISALSKLHIDDSEIGKISKEINGILGYMRTVNDSVNTDDVDEQGLPDPRNVMREDIVKVSQSRAELLENCPEHTESTPIVPKTVD